MHTGEVTNEFLMAEVMGEHDYATTVAAVEAAERAAGLKQAGDKRVLMTLEKSEVPGRAGMEAALMQYVDEYQQTAYSALLARNQGSGGERVGKEGAAAAWRVGVRREAGALATAMAKYGDGGGERGTKQVTVVIYPAPEDAEGAAALEISEVLGTGVQPRVALATGPVISGEGGARPTGQLLKIVVRTLGRLPAYSTGKQDETVVRMQESIHRSLTAAAHGTCLSGYEESSMPLQWGVHYAPSIIYKTGSAQQVEAILFKMRRIEGSNVEAVKMRGDCLTGMYLDVEVMGRGGKWTVARAFAGRPVPSTETVTLSVLGQHTCWDGIRVNHDTCLGRLMCVVPKIVDAEYDPVHEMVKAREETRVGVEARCPIYCAWTAHRGRPAVCQGPGGERRPNGCKGKLGSCAVVDELPEEIVTAWEAAKAAVAERKGDGGRRVEGGIQRGPSQQAPRAGWKPATPTAPSPRMVRCSYPGCRVCGRVTNMTVKDILQWQCELHSDAGVEEREGDKAGRKASQLAMAGLPEIPEEGEEGEGEESEEGEEGDVMEDDEAMAAAGSQGAVTYEAETAGGGNGWTTQESKKMAKARRKQEAAARMALGGGIAKERKGTAGSGPSKAGSPSAKKSTSPGGSKGKSKQRPA